ncbi:ATP-binding cassette domain-containing protein [Streptosporangium sp. NPDC023615]|uniref:ATP-binding cassette domain-containing protein n=1 Tax=Streptosporangium sp. NPDC023615 TaxID=3154794 RepID=UPI0034432067
MRLSVEVRGVSKRYGPRQVFDGLNLELLPGVTGLLGPNGAGKSTLMRCLASTLMPDAGRVHVLGLDLSDREQRLQARRTIGYLPQELGLYPQFSVSSLVDYVAILNEITDRRQRRREVERVLEEVDLLTERKSKVRRLSGGMKQRLGIAIALIGNPQFLILDEPMVGLDPEQRMRFRGLLSRLGENRIVLLSTHQTEDVAALCQRVLVMQAGTFLFDGPPHQIANQATGQVWLSAYPSAEGQAGWRAADGRYRVVGAPPLDAEPAEPTVEDGYLVLLNARAEKII